MHDGEVLSGQIVMNTTRISCSTRAAGPQDWPRIWELLRPIIRKGEYLPLPVHWSDEEARAFWFLEGNASFLGELGGELIWAYYICPVFIAGASHVANAAYAVGDAFLGQGRGEEMVRHSMTTAREAGFLAMEYKIVLSSNAAALGLYRKLGFDVIGIIPRGYLHPRLNYIDTVILHREL